MKLALFVMLGALTLAACGGGLSTPEQRAAALCGASLKIIRAEHLAMAGKLTMDESDLRADSAFARTVRLDLRCIHQWVLAGESSCGHEIEDFLDAAKKLPERAAPDDPASVIRTVLSEAPESAAHLGPLFDGYAAVFQLCLEMERDGTLLQDFLPMLVEIGCPGTLKDLGLDKVSKSRLQEISAKASEMTAQMPYPTEQEHYYITFVKLNNWASKFSGQVTADTLAARMLATEGSDRVIGHLRNKGPMRIGFFGDSHMDRIHWSTMAPFPDITGAVLKRINSEMISINAGKGGDDSGEGLARIDRSLIAHKPDVTFVMFGGNDAQHWGDPEPAVTPEQFRINLEEIVTRLRAAGSRVVIMSYPLGPTREGVDLEDFEAIRVQTRQVASEMNTGWLDVAEILDQEPPEKVFAVDLIHFNPNTHMEIAGMVLARLAAMESMAEWNQKNQKINRTISRRCAMRAAFSTFAILFLLLGVFSPAAGRDYYQVDRAHWVDNGLVLGWGSHEPLIFRIRRGRQPPV